MNQLPKTLRAIDGGNDETWEVSAFAQCARCGRNIFTGRGPAGVRALRLANGQLWCPRAECIRGTDTCELFTSCTVVGE